MTGKVAVVEGPRTPLTDEIGNRLSTAGYELSSGADRGAAVVVYVAGAPADHGQRPDRIGSYVSAVLDGADSAVAHLGHGDQEERSVVLVAPSVGTTLTTGPESVSAAIGALKGLCRAWAVTMGPRAVRCNIVLPGILVQDVTETDTFPTIPLAGDNRRLGTNRDVAEVVVYLASADASYLNGAELDVDGGLKEHRHALASVLWDEGIFTADRWPF